MSEHEVRPRFGKIVRNDGREEALVFHPLGENQFIALNASDDTKQLVLGPNENMWIDAITTSQTVVYHAGAQGGWVTADVGRTSGPDPHQDEKWEMLPPHASVEMEFDHIDPEVFRLLTGQTLIGEEEDVGNKSKDPNGWWKALVALAGIAAIVVFTIAGINWAISL